MGRGQGQTITGVLRKDDYLIQGIKLFAENMEFSVEDSNKLLRFLNSTSCPSTIKGRAYQEAKLLVENEEAWEAETLSDEDDAAYREANFYFYVLMDDITLLETAMLVSDEDRQIIFETAQPIIADLKKKKLIREDHKAVIIPFTFSQRKQDGKLFVPYGQQLPIVGATLINALLIGNKPFLKKVIAHELIHGNATFYAGIPDEVSDETLYPKITKAHRIFLNEGIVDWLANHYSTGDPNLNPDDLGQEVWYNVNKYLRNTLFISENITPYLTSVLGDGETIQGKMTDLLRNIPGQTELRRALESVPSLQQKLEALQDLTYENPLETP